MLDISALVITYNEEKNIERCLKSLSFCKEIIVVDSGSNDRTIELASGYTQSIFSREMIDGYGPQRNFGIDKAKYDWILWLDADEEISQELAETIKNIPVDSAFSGFYINRMTKYLGRWIKHSGWYPQFVLRLFDRNKGRCKEAKIHESIELKGKTGKLKGDILHYAYSNISHHIEKMNTYTDMTAEDRISKGRKFSMIKAVYAPPGEFIKKYILKRGFLDGIPGFAIAVSSAYYVFLKEIKIHEMKIKNNPGE